MAMLPTACIPSLGGRSEGTTEIFTATPEPAGHLGYGIVSGTVTSSLSGAPLPGATVTCEHFSYFPISPCNGEATTDADGSFQFENIFFHDTDGITLTVQADGYTTKTITSPFFTRADWEVSILLDPLPTADTVFRHMTDQQAFPEGVKIFDLWISPQGTVWVATDAGLYIGFPEQGGGFAKGYDETLKQIIGLQEDPYTIWALGADGATIHAFNGKTWADYGLDDGWDPLPYRVKSIPPAVAPDGVVWLATGADDLRRFDLVSGTWSSMHATELGFSSANPDYQGHFLTDAVVASDGSLWVSDCIGMGEGFEGQGVRTYQDGEWNSLPATGGQCVSDLERGMDGRMWVGGEDAILVYDPVSNSWREVPPPAWDRQQYIMKIALDPTGNPAIGTLQCGGASCDTIAYFIQQDEGWLPLLNTGTYYWPDPGFILDADGSAWNCWEGAVFHQAGMELTPIGTLRTGSCEVIVDGSGIAWVAAFNGEDAGLWQVVR